MEQTVVDVVIPTLNKADLVADLLDDICTYPTGVSSQLGTVWVIDNGSGHDERGQIQMSAVEQTVQGVDVRVHDMAGATIHQMWNWAINQTPERHHLAVLNNDIRLSPNCLHTLSTVLTNSPDLWVVSPNYDGRPNSTVTAEICAGRYDGTGGIAGFAFLMRKDDGYRFPNDLSWWFGDADMVHTGWVEHKKPSCVYAGATVHHVDGGSKTGGEWEEGPFADLVAEDRKTFSKKWIDSGLLHSK